MNRITERTFIPISLLIVIIGGVVWLTNIYAQTTENTKSITGLVEKRESDSVTLREISNQLSEIQGELRSMRREHHR